MIPTIRYQTRAPPPFDSCRYDKLHLLDWIGFRGKQESTKEGRKQGRKRQKEDFVVVVVICQIGMSLRHTNLAFFPSPFMFPHHKIQQTQKKHTQIFPTTQHNSTPLDSSCNPSKSSTRHPTTMPTNRALNILALATFVTVGVFMPDLRSSRHLAADDEDWVSETNKQTTG